ncbi:4-hydroxy-tetrahydrodipicolinate synthase [Buchnera aphidicola]|uniref:4-hydroxy-tetrahydrodipicolinate synthase n=1 Tax=Buchnera aphidicola TaxID=9 RepID=UPI00209371E0|nr:4-hydroxy-tetrahydrodipicolinate synthase [Buchnera aphidicola]USS94197.1 4-hydroxy-tetrahydrodipicolinate synthase [Buchnera aphidicola (Sipha maydis)]WII23745.1 4-hydroxy-tetrahydrodipicolinate synthase [Buchnera aphidicola (Sipha maydis)]
MFKGNIVALITPMNKKEKICLKSLRNIINYHIYNQTKAIVSLGTTGESSTFTHQEHIKLVLLTIKLSQNKIPIIAGTGANSTKEAVLLTQKFEKSGISACLSVTPYYNKPSQEGLYQHFKTISENTNIPQILYNVPSRTGCDLLPQTIYKLSKLKNIIGIKEASGNLSRLNQIKYLVDKNFLIFSGDDSTSLDFMQLGGNGIISVTANIAAKEMSKICQLSLSGDFSQARKINKKLIKLHNILFLESNPIPIKWAAYKLGLIKYNTLRLPMTQPSKKLRKIISTELKKKKIYTTKKNNIFNLFKKK